MNWLGVFLNFQLTFVQETLYFRYFLLNLRERYVAFGEISVQCGDWEINEEEACKVYDFFDYNGGAVYADSFGEAI